ncbi:MAG: pseudouridine synthase, partial [Phycisphaerales bacterium JB039]
QAWEGRAREGQGWERPESQGASTRPRSGRATQESTFSLVELELRTGRTHQIRVHLAHLGWPIVADDMYGGRPVEGPRGPLIVRQALHAALLAFSHPITGETLSFVAPVPPDMLGLIQWLRQGEVEQVHVEQTVPLKRLGLG